MMITDLKIMLYYSKNHTHGIYEKFMFEWRNVRLKVRNVAAFIGVRSGTSLDGG